jgi:hypothetical protein
MRVKSHAHMPRQLLGLFSLGPDLKAMAAPLFIFQGSYPPKRHDSFVSLHLFGRNALPRGFIRGAEKEIWEFYTGGCKPDRSCARPLYLGLRIKAASPSRLDGEHPRNGIATRPGSAWPETWRAPPTPSARGSHLAGGAHEEELETALVLGGDLPRSAVRDRWLRQGPLLPAEIYVNRHVRARRRNA